jgi:histidyl-tRNA synthetase
LKTGALPTDRHCPTQVLVVLPDEESRAKCNAIAKELRKRGVATEIFHLAQKMQKQIRYADRKGIPLVLFPHRYSDDSPNVEVKTLASGEQVEMPLRQWLASR